MHLLNDYSVAIIPFLEWTITFMKSWSGWLRAIAHFV